MSNVVPVFLEVHLMAIHHAAKGASNTYSHRCAVGTFPPDDAAIEREFNLIRSSGLGVRSSCNVVPAQIRQTEAGSALDLMR